MILAPQDQPVIAYWRVLKWSPEFWEQFCEQQRLIHEGTVPDHGLVKTAKEWGITIVELQHLKLECGLIADEHDRRTKLSDRMLALSEMSVDLAYEKMQSDEETGELKLRHTAQMARTFSDAALNLKNGTAMPSINYNFTDIKAILALNRSMPDEFVPIKVNEGQKEESKAE